MKELAEGYRRVAVIDPECRGDVYDCRESMVIGHGKAWLEDEAPAECFAPEPKFKVGEYVTDGTWTRQIVVDCEYTDGDSVPAGAQAMRYPKGSVVWNYTDGFELAPLTPGCYAKDGKPCPEEFAKKDGRENVPEGMMILPEPRERRKGETIVDNLNGGVYETVLNAQSGYLSWIVVPDPDYMPELVEGKVYMFARDTLPRVWRGDHWELLQGGRSYTDGTDYDRPATNADFSAWVNMFPTLAGHLLAKYFGATA